jgi:cytochrome P450
MVSAISKELTSRMLATILDFPFEKRHKLADWSDTITASPETTGGTTTREEIFEAAVEFAREFAALWWDKKARKDAGEEMGFDLISLMLNNDDTKDLIERPMEFMGNLTLLVVGGNDTTRNSITGGVLALNQNPEEFKKLKADPSLIPNMVSEIIRWQTPLAYMRRIAKEDVVLNGQTIKKGDKVIMWYASANRDESKIENADKFLIDRKGARNHLSFGFGIHRCMGNRLAEMQLRILWEEILKRFDDIKVIDEPGYVQSNFVKGYTNMTVEFVPKAPAKAKSAQKSSKKASTKTADA